MSWYENIFEFITDRSKRLSARATIIVLTICCLIFIDNIIGFSYYYNRQRQLDQLQSISVLMKDSTLSRMTHENLIKLEQQTFERQNIIELSSKFFKNIFSSSTKREIVENKEKFTRNNFWFLISTSGLYIIVTIFVVPVLLITDKKTPFLKLIATLLIFMVVMFFSSWFNFWLLDKLIPNKLFGSWIWNYILNFIIQIGLVSGLYWSTKTMNNANK